MTLWFGGEAPTSLRRFSAVLLLFAALAAAACSVASKTRSMFGGKLPFEVEVAPDANEHSAIAVDLIVVYDSRLVEPLMKLRAAEWFAQKKQYRKDHPKEVEVHEWEWVPSQQVGKLSIAYQSGAQKVVVFADYGTDGDHRAAVEPQQSFDLRLRNIDFDLKVKE
jgi:type VI secretion system protein